MYLAMSIAASGLRNQQTRIDSIANNVANANTVGFKNARLDFKDSLYTVGLTPGPNRTVDGNLKKGHGLMTNAVTRDFKQAHFERTERELDFAIENEGFFAFQNAVGEVVYGRNGVFNLSVEADGTYIVNGEGLYVLDENENRIQIPLGTNKIEYDTDGTLRFVTYDSVELGRATLGMFTFRNLKGLAAAGSTTFSATPAAGERRLAENAILRQGVIEGSNVKLADEMARLIRTQRAFQLASRALSTADQMEGIANQMRR
ncbi:MAG: flagellar hook-basal body protein [Oscillospiraceae bacterium]|nr:flagellar hook-basal body protein [Oscillospiraceae bacterium]